MVGFPLIIVAFALLPARCNGSVTIQSSTTLSFEAMFGQPFDPQEHHRHLQKDVKDCKIVEKCEMCTFTDQKSIPACKETGRKNRMECDTRNGDGKYFSFCFLSWSAISTLTLSPLFYADWTTETDFYSCKYTEADEQFAMVGVLLLAMHPHGS